MNPARSPLVYLVLALTWAGFGIWQGVEHTRVRAAANQSELNRSTDIANSLAVVIRSQRRMGTVSRDRLVGALEDLAQSKELQGIALLSPAGETVAAGGQEIPGDLSTFKPGDFTRSTHRLVVASQVELGPEQLPSFGGDRNREEVSEEKRKAAIVWSPEGDERGSERGSGSAERGSDSMRAETFTGPPREHHAPGSRLPPPEGAPRPAEGSPESTTGTGTGTSTTGPATAPNPDGTPATLSPEEEAAEQARREERREQWRQRRASHPFWMSPEKYDEVYARLGLHLLVLMLDTNQTDEAVEADLLLRLAMTLVALVAALAVGLSWRSLTRSTELQMRLVRAQAMNNYLRELNLAAAGLAHETRNPLNVVRGLAQIVATRETTPKESRKQLETVLTEVDRVTARLNEFIDYSRPREAMLQPVSPTTLARDIAETLATDIEDKDIRFECAESPLKVMADVAMFRQVMFNLILNATQAVTVNGRIGIELTAVGDEVELSIYDDGPGVPAEAQEDIFRPYFSLNEQGSGLGLAIVRQIVLAHGWELRYLPRAEGGAVFRITGMKRHDPETP